MALGGGDGGGAAAGLYACVPPTSDGSGWVDSSSELIIGSMDEAVAVIVTQVGGRGAHMLTIMHFKLTIQPVILGHPRL